MKKNDAKPPPDPKGPAVANALRPNFPISLSFASLLPSLPFLPFLSFLYFLSFLPFLSLLSFLSFLSSFNSTLSQVWGGGGQTGAGTPQAHAKGPATNTAYAKQFQQSEAAPKSAASHQGLHSLRYSVHCSSV